MLFYIFLPNLQYDENKNKKNSIADYCHFSKNKSSNKNLLWANNTNDKIFSNIENKKNIYLHLKKLNGCYIKV